MTGPMRVALGAIGAVLVLIVLVMLFAFHGYSVPSDMVAVHVQAGPIQPKKVVGCKPPSTRGWFTNDDYKYYPTSEREWEATGQKGSDAEPYESVTDDKVIMKMPVTVRFTLKTDCKTLQDFYVKYGRRYDVEFKNDGTYDETGANYNEAWLTVLRKLVANPTDQTLDRIVQGYTWENVWNNPKTKTAIEQKLTEALRSKKSLLVQTAHKAYFDDITVLVGKPIPPKALGNQVAKTQEKVAKAQAQEAQANADKTKAEAQTKVALAEGAKQRAVIAGFGGIDGYLRYQCILHGCNPYQPSYGTALTPRRSRRDRKMTWWGWTLWIVLAWVMLFRAHGMTEGLHVAAFRRRLSEPKRNQVSASLAKTDRLIREQEHELFPDEKHKHRDCVICGPGPILQGMVPSQYEHPFFKDGKETVHDSYSSWERDCLVPTMAEYAETVSSKVIANEEVTGLHTIMLDIDMPVTLVESSTPGHYHLYIDHLITWSMYKQLLRAMQSCGLIETDYYKMSVSHGATYLRPPWVRKQSKPRRKRKRDLVAAVWTNRTLWMSTKHPLRRKL